MAGLVLPLVPSSSKDALRLRRIRLSLVETCKGRSAAGVEVVVHSLVYQKVRKAHIDRLLCVLCVQLSGAFHCRSLFLDLLFQPEIDESVGGNPLFLCHQLDFFRKVFLYRIVGSFGFGHHLESHFFRLWPNVAYVVFIPIITDLRIGSSFRDGTLTFFHSASFHCRSCRAPTQSKLPGLSYGRKTQSSTDPNSSDPSPSKGFRRSGGLSRQI